MEELPLTHEFLARLLGVRRASVTDVLHPLQEAELIHYRRGKITVVDRERLEATSCECYWTITKYYNRLLTGS
jgi:Mn-dependent DtxR family transcriptional regulator